MEVVVNPTLVTIQAKTDEWSRTVFEAVSEDGSVLATILPNFEPGARRLEMKDEATGVVYSLPVDAFFTEDGEMKDDWEFILERFLNKIGLTLQPKPV